MAALCIRFYSFPQGDARLWIEKPLLPIPHFALALFRNTVYRFSNMEDRIKHLPLRLAYKPVAFALNTLDRMEILEKRAQMEALSRCTTLETVSQQGCVAQKTSRISFEEAQKGLQESQTRINELRHRIAARQRRSRIFEF
jgi:hypothetical protein